MDVPAPAPAAAGPCNTIVQHDSAFGKRIKRRVSARPHVFFAVCPPGLGGICEQEILKVSQKAKEIFSDHYKINEIKGRPGGIEFKTRLKTACLANMLMGSATRILMRLASFKAESFRRLEDRIKAVDWELYLPWQTLPDIKVTTHKSRLYHSSAIADRISPILQDRLFPNQTSPHPDITGLAASPTQTLMVRADNNRFELSLDMSGTPLYKRSIKEKVVKAPLRETLAFAILTRLGLSGNDTLVDPMCGSGTFSLEGAMMQSQLPPGVFRSFAFEAWPGFEKKSMAHAHGKLMSAAVRFMHARPLPPILARDLDGTAIDHLKQTCAQHKAFQRIRPVCDDFFNMIPPAVTDNQGVVVLNPPYGIRLDKRHDITALYKEIGHKLASDFKGFRAAIICPGKQAFQALHLGLASMPIFHGGLDLHTAVGVIGKQD